MKLKQKKYIVYFLLLISAGIFYSCSSSGAGDIKTEDPDEAFRIAKGMFDKGDYTAAIEAFSFIKIKFPGTKNADQIQFYLAESYYNRKEYLLGAYEYENMLKNYTLSPLLAASRYKLGMCYYYLSPKYALDQEFTRYAISELQLFVELYPDDKNARDASVRLMELKDKLAYKDLTIADQYMKLEDYKSAAIYYGIVYETYIDSKYADEAMVGQADALISSNKFMEASKILDRFFKLFPNSKFKQRAEKLKSSLEG